MAHRALAKPTAFALILAGGLVGSAAAAAEPGVFAGRIVFGQSAALGGPAAAPLVYLRPTPRLVPGRFA